jgi:hypothetical protein
MALIDQLANAQNGQFFANAGKAAGLSEGEARLTMEAICPAIALALREHVEQPDRLELLLDYIEDDDAAASLDDPAFASDPETAKDGAAILTDLYGSKAKALRQLRDIAPSVDKQSLNTLAAIAAASALTVLARSQRQALGLAGVQPALGASGGGLLGTIVSAVVEGAIKGAVRQLTPKPRRRRTYRSYRRRSPKTKRRRTRQTSLDSLFREILNSIR